MEGSQEQLESFYAALRNLNDLELRSFRNVIKSVFSPTLRESYLTVNYHRAAFNVEMLLATKDTKQFQAVALLARAVFELAVEIKLINLDKEAAKKDRAILPSGVAQVRTQAGGFQGSASRRQISL